MPSRILRESIVTSESVASLPPDAQDRLPRYFLLADDFGCFLANPAVIRGHIYPLRPDVTEAIVAGDLRAFAGNAIVHLYTGPDGREYGCFPNWTTHQRPPRPTSKRKYPKPPKFSSDPDFAANARKSPQETSPAFAANPGLFLPYAQSQAQSLAQSLEDRVSQAQASREREPQAQPVPDPVHPAPPRETLDRLKAALNLTDLDPSWQRFVGETAKYPVEQFVAGAEKYIAERHKPGEHGPGYVRAMIERGAGMPLRNGNGHTTAPEKPRAKAVPVAPGVARWKAWGYDSLDAYVRDMLGPEPEKASAELVNTCRTEGEQPPPDQARDAADAAEREHAR